MDTAYVRESSLPNRAEKKLQYTPENQPDWLENHHFQMVDFPFSHVSFRGDTSKLVTV